MPWCGCRGGAGLAGVEAAGFRTVLEIAFCRCSAATFGGIFSRESGEIVAVTRPQSSASSGLSDRTGRNTLRKQKEGLSGRGHAAGDRRRLGSAAPEGVEAVGALDRAADILRN